MDTLCAEHPKYKNEIGLEESAKPFVIQDELLWGASYRHFKKKEKGNTLLYPAKAPIDIPLELCRARQKRKRSKVAKSQKKIPENQKMKKLSLLEKSVLSQSKYMEYLSVPNPKFEEPPIKKRKRRCEMEPCPPRFVQLAVPNKRRVYANWKDYHTILPTEMILRFEQILHTDKNLEPRDARYYYKKIDKQKKAQARAKKRLLKKKQKRKERGDKMWLENHIDDSVKAIIDFIKNEPLFSLNYKQVMLSDGILTKLDKNRILKKPKRNTRNYYRRTIIEVCDKLALWMDTLIKFVDVQAIESKEDIPPLTISSLEEEESEEESDEEMSEEESEKMSDEDEGDEGGESEATTEVESSAEEYDEGISTGKWNYQDEGEGGDFDMDIREEGEGKAVLDQFIEHLADLDDTSDILDQLIEIYENSPDDFLMSEVEGMPGITHMDVLNKLRELKGELADKGPKRSTLEEAMIEWAKELAPEKVDEKILRAIHEFACALNGKLRPLQEEETEITEEAVEGEIDGETIVPVEQSEPSEEKENEGIGEDEEQQNLGTLDDIEEGQQPEQEVDDEQRAEEDENKPTEEEEQTDIEDKIDEGDIESDQIRKEEDIVENEVQAEPDVISEAGTDLVLNFDELTEHEETKDAQGEDQVKQGEDQDTPETETQKEADTAEWPVEEQESEEKVVDIIYEAGEAAEVSPQTEGDEMTPQTVEEEFTIQTEGEELEESPQPAEQADAERIPSVAEERLPTAEGVAPTPEEPPAVSEADQMIKGHKPLVTVEHSPSTVCCLSLKIWAVWLLEITHNAHTWTKWMHEVIKQVREFSAIIRGDVKLPNGEKKVLYKEDWRKFTKDTEEKIIAWRQYSAHVKDLSTGIIDSFHQKKVNCCPKCLQDNLIKNVVTAHETLQALADAMNCAGYWQRCLDNLVQHTTVLTDFEEEDMASSESDGDNDVEFEELEVKREDSDDSIYEIEELDPSTHMFRPNR